MVQAFSVCRVVGVAAPQVGVLYHNVGQHALPCPNKHMPQAIIHTHEHRGGCRLICAHRHCPPHMPALLIQRWHHIPYVHAGCQMCTCTTWLHAKAPSSCPWSCWSRCGALLRAAQGCSSSSSSSSSRTQGMQACVVSCRPPRTSGSERQGWRQRSPPGTC